MSEPPRTTSTDTTPQPRLGRFRPRDTRRLTNRLRESLEDGEYSPDSSPSRYDDSGYNGDEVQKDRKEVDNVGSGVNKEVEAHTSTQQTLNHSGISVLKAALNLSPSSLGEIMESVDTYGVDGDVKTQEGDKQQYRFSADTQQAIHHSGINVSEEVTNFLNHPNGEWEDSTDVSGVNEDVGYVGTAYTIPLTGASRKRFRYSPTTKTLCEYEVDFDEYIQEPVNLNFSQYVVHPDSRHEVRTAKRQRANITIDDHAHPYSVAAITTPPIPQGAQWVDPMSKPGNKSNRVQQLDNNGVLRASKSTQTPSSRPISNPPVPLATPDPNPPLFDEFATFANADCSTLQRSWDGTDFSGIQLTDEPLSRQNCTTNLLDLDTTWMDASQNVQVHSVPEIGKQASNKTPEEIMDESWQAQLEVYDQDKRPLTVGGGNPQWENWRRSGDPSWDEDSQAQDPFAFVNPFNKLLGYKFGGRYDYDKDLFRQVKLHYGHPPEILGEDCEEETLGMRLRGGALPKPQGENGLDEHDLAAVENLVQDHPRLEEDPNGEHAEERQNKERSEGEHNGKRSGDGHTDKHVEDGSTGQRVEESQQNPSDRVDVSRHLRIGQVDDGVCWCVGMPEFDEYRRW
jgi:hypothetical protein